VAALPRGPRHRLEQTSQPVDARTRMRLERLVHPRPLQKQPNDTPRAQSWLPTSKRLEHRRPSRAGRDAPSSSEMAFVAPGAGQMAHAATRAPGSRMITSSPVGWAACQTPATSASCATLTISAPRSSHTAKHTSAKLSKGAYAIRRKKGDSRHDRGPPLGCLRSVCRQCVRHRACGALRGARGGTCSRRARAR